LFGYFLSFFLVEFFVGTQLKRVDKEKVSIKKKVKEKISFLSLFLAQHQMYEVLCQIK
jgi:hypothetical protein